MRIDSVEVWGKSLRSAGSSHDEAIIERPAAVRAISRLTVEMLLMVRLRRPDVLPADDYGLRKGFAIASRNVARSVRLDWKTTPADAPALDGDQ